MLVIAILVALVAFGIGRILPDGFVKSAWQDGRRVTPRKQFWI